jgi:hypothetical protein
MQDDHPEVSIHVRGRRSPKRADLYIATLDGVVSIEFKYAGPHGVRDPHACAAQVRLYVAKHAATLLVLYNGGGNKTSPGGADRLRGLLRQTARVIIIPGPGIPTT